MRLAWHETDGEMVDSDLENIPFFLRPPSVLVARLARVVVDFSLGMVASVVRDWLKSATRR
jgi:hypothetical protein